MSRGIEIRNETKGRLLADRGELASSMRERMVGLLGRKELPEGHALIIDPCNSIHTFFMKFPIDVAFVDRSHRIVSVIEKMRPFRVSRIYPRARYVIELPSGVLERTETQRGDRVSWSFPGDRATSQRGKP